MNSFQDILDSVKPVADSALVDQSRFSFAFDESWLQGRTAFGGLSAALLVKALSQELDVERKLRALSVSFIGPTPPGSHEIHTRSLRDGGSVSHRYGELVTAEGVAVNATAAFGKDRASSVSISGPQRPEAPAPEDCERFPWIPGITPDFTQHFEMRLIEGNWPLSGGDNADFSMWMRFKESANMDLCRLVALTDVPPMPGLNRVKFPSAGSSLSWYLECPNDPGPQSSDDWWYLDYRCQAASNGYFHNNALIWAPNGVLAMISRQVATIFEKAQ